MMVRLEWLSSTAARDDWKVARLSPETVKGYNTLSKAGTKTNHLDAKTGELITLAVAVTLRCDGCITVHAEAAIKHGPSIEEIAEALGVAVCVNAGAALVYSARVMDAYELNPTAAGAATKRPTDRSRHRRRIVPSSNERMKATAVVADS
jgi:AhpD family alkylhydroperoxidase